MKKSKAPNYNALMLDTTHALSNLSHTPHSTVSSMNDMPHQPNSSVSPAFMEGPLPSEVREIIRKDCSRLEDIDDAEKQARKLLSVGKRLQVYRSELQAALEEVVDIEKGARDISVVCATLQAECSDIDAKIEALQKEKLLCQQQFLAQQQRLMRENEQLSIAAERVTILRRTVENITSETQTNQLLLRQLVPSLNIDNYI